MPATEKNTEIPNIKLAERDVDGVNHVELHVDSLHNLSQRFGRDMPIHRHDRYFQIHYLESGRIELNLGGQHYRGEGPLFFSTPPTVPHSFVLNEEPVGVAITIRQDMFSRMQAGEDPALTAQFSSPLFLELGALGVTLARDAEKLTALLKILSEEYYQTRPGRQYSLSALISLVLVCLFRLAQLPERKTPARKAELDILRAYNELIEAHFTEHWPLARYAAELNVTAGRLADICKRLSGQSPKAMIFERQVEEARWQLIYTTSTISHIAYDLGFADPAYFCRFFKKHSGKSPSDFRSQTMTET